MSVFRKKSPWLILLMTGMLILGIASQEILNEENTTNVTELEVKSNSTKDLDASESADPKKIEILKQIRKVNDDGSYTVGYEAGDGTFKIESRDVQGNIKGTFGYVDPNGEIKRVSYSTSNSSQTSTLPPHTLSVRANRTSIRRAQPTLVYPKTSLPTKPTVIQSIPRRKPANVVSSTPTVTTTESYRVVSRITPNMNSSVSEKQNIPLIYTQTTAETLKAALLNEEPKVNQEEKIATEINNTLPSNLIRSSLVFEKFPERLKDSQPARANTFRRQLGTSHYDNGPMYAFQQSAGDDTTDVYGGSIALGTPRPLFTTTTGRPRLLHVHNIVASRHKALEKSIPPQVHEEQQESTLEATTNKIGDEKFVTINPVPILQYPTPQENVDPRVLERPYIRPSQQIPIGPVPIVQFKTREFLRDNPGAAVPIGNQRVLFRYNPNIQVERNAEFVAQHIQSVTPPNIVHVANRPPIQHDMGNPDGIPDSKSNVVAIPIYQGNQQPRYPNHYNPYNNIRENNFIPQRIQVPVVPIPQPIMNEIPPISAPVSTRDLKLLLQQLLIRQNRLQTLIDIREGLSHPGPPYQHPYVQQPQVYENDYRNQKQIFGPRPVYPRQYSEARQYNSFVPQYDPYQPAYQNQVNQYQGRNDYRPQDDSYRNEVAQFDPTMHYESQRYVPRRRFYGRQYDPRYEDVNSGNENEEQAEYLPPDVREALLLKMLMLAINPDFNPMPPDPQVMMTTPVPEFRKKVRNVQILGEETDTKDTESKTEKRML